MRRRAFTRSASHTPSAPTILIAAVAAVGLLLALTVIAVVAPRGVPGLNYYELDAQFDDAAQIADLSEVRMGGRHVGQVTNSEQRDGRATVRLQLFPGEGPLPVDTKARIRLKGLLGAKFVDVIPGKSGRDLPNDGTLPARQTSTTVELLDVLQALDKPTRANLQAAVKGLGEGFLGRGEDINEALGVGPEFYAGTGDVSEAILARPGAAARFAPSAEALAGAYDPVREELASGFAPEARALQAFVDARKGLEGTLAAAPPSLDALHDGLDAATPLLDEVAGLARATVKLTDPAPAALRETSALLRAARPALRHSTPLLTNLEDAVDPTLGFLARVDPVIPPSVRALVNNLPGLRQLDRHGCDFLSFGRNWRSTLGFGVAPGFGDPIGTLDDGQEGLGPVTSLRVVPARLTELESLLADSPPADAAPGRSPYPEPCAAVKEKTR